MALTKTLCWLSFANCESSNSRIHHVYSGYAVEAKQRIAARDVNDWPIVAAALLLDCPIWTEDNDFFGCGVATWTTDRVRLFLCID